MSYDPEQTNQVYDSRIGDIDTSEVYGEGDSEGDVEFLDPADPASDEFGDLFDENGMLITSEER